MAKRDKIIEEPYSKSEINLMMENIDEKFKSVHEKLDAILKQTTLTNGRVLDNQNRLSKLENWRYYIVGGLAVISYPVYKFVEIVLNHISQ